LTTKSTLHYLTHVEIIALNSAYWEEEPRGFWTYILLPSLSRLQHLTHLSLTGLPCEGPCLPKLRHYAAGLISSSKLPFLTLEELTLQELDTLSLSILGMMQLPNLRLLGIQERRDYDDPEEIDCTPVKFFNWAERDFPISLPRVTHILLYKMSSDIVSHNRLLQSAPSVTHLVVSHYFQPEEWDPKWLIWRSQTCITGNALPSLCPNLQELTICCPRGKLRDFKAIVDSRLPTFRKLRIGKGQVDRMENYVYWGKKRFLPREDTSRQLLGDILEVTDYDFPYFHDEVARMRTSLAGGA